MFALQNFSKFLQPGCPAASPVLPDSCNIDIYDNNVSISSAGKKSADTYVISDNDAAEHDCESGSENTDSDSYRVPPESDDGCSSGSSHDGNELTDAGRTLSNTESPVPFPDDDVDAVETRSNAESPEQISGRNCNVRYFDKKPYCFYCGIAQSQIQRHWLIRHKNELQVIQIASSKDKTERLKHIIRLRNMGNHLHNVEVLKEQKGELLVTYRTKQGAQPSEYVPCEHCFGYLLKRDLHRHKCKVATAKSAGRTAASASLLLPPPKGTSVQVFELLNGMSDGNIKRVAQNDSLIIDYAAKFVAKKGLSNKMCIRDKIRKITRFLLQMREQEGLSNISMAECITPEKFKQCVIAIKGLAGFQEHNMTYTTPSLALKIGHTLQKMAKLVKRNAIECKDEEKIKSADYFSELCNMEWRDEVSRHAVGTLQEKRKNAVNLLPLSSDVLKLNEYLNSQSEKLRAELSNENTDTQTAESIWQGLTEVTLAQIIAFNGRCQDEVSQMTVQEYNNRSAINLAQCDSIGALSALEKNLCKLFVRVELKGKQDCTVPVLLLPKIESSIELLIRHRTAACIRSSNVYVFAYSHSEDHLRSCDVLRNAAQACGAENPLSLHSANFRKHVATLTQLLNVKDSELDSLAQYMGHDIRVHREEFYMLPNDVMDTSKLAKLFLLMESGQIASQKRKSLDELLVTMDVESHSVSKCI